MKVFIFYLLIIIFSFSIGVAEARKKTSEHLNNKTYSEPQLQALWFEDDYGNKLESYDDVDLGDLVEIVITANKATNGKLVNLDMEEEACIFELVSDTYKSDFGIIKDIVITGDSLEDDESERPLNNQTRLKFKVVEETDECLTGYEKAYRKYRRTFLCDYYRSWPYRRRTNSKISQCH